MVGNLLTGDSPEINVTKTSDVVIGDPVEVTFVDAAEGVVLPQWALVGRSYG